VVHPRAAPGVLVELGGAQRRRPGAARPLSAPPRSGPHAGRHGSPPPRPAALPGAAGAAAALFAGAVGGPVARLSRPQSQAAGALTPAAHRSTSSPMAAAGAIPVPAAGPFRGAASTLPS